MNIVICEFKRENLEKLKPFVGMVCRLRLASSELMTQQWNNPRCNNAIHRIDSISLNKEYSGSMNGGPKLLMMVTKWDHKKLKWGEHFSLWENKHLFKVGIKYLHIAIIPPDEYILYKLLEG